MITDFNLPKQKHDYKKQGKKNRAAGKRFEKKVEEDLESNGWIVMRFAKQVDLKQNKLINPKPHFNPFLKSISYAGTGFPDFICIKMFDNYKIQTTGEEGYSWLIQFVECKVNGTLSKIEKEKVEWILSNLHIPVFVANKGEKRGEIIYNEYLKGGLKNV